MRYTQVYDGQWVRPIHKGYKLACCDCGLIHRMDFKIDEDAAGRRHVEFRVRRDRKATAARRRRKGIERKVLDGEGLGR